MEQLYILSDRMTAGVSTVQQRYLYQLINWSEHLICIRGSRGVGKTTMLLQHIKDNGWMAQKALYVSLDHTWFSTHTLLDLAEYHYTHGGTHLFLDEVHRMPQWLQQIKNIADFYPGLYVVFTGSSLLKLDNAVADLSRRCMTYTMQGLSFREYLQFEGVADFDTVKLDDILQSHVQLSLGMNSGTHLLPYFDKYLKTGYYPFYKAVPDTYQFRLQQVISAIIEVDIPQTGAVEYSSVYKAKQLLTTLAGLVPYTLNISDLCKTIGTTRNQLLRLLDLLERSTLVRKIYPEKGNIQSLGKPEKILFDNTNLMYALTTETESGTLRETFFCNQLGHSHTMTMPARGDVLVDEKWLFEVGGHGKKYKQISNIADSYVVADNIETGNGNKIPLWLFGMMY